MNSQIQCPVCTLFLHAGMNLQDHLETHPKEKVIAALVNMTLLQQQANDEDASSFKCSRYEPLTDDLDPLPQQPATVPPDGAQQPRSHLQQAALIRGGGVYEKKQITYYNNTTEKQTQPHQQQQQQPQHQQHQQQPQQQTSARRVMIVNSRLRSTATAKHDVTSDSMRCYIENAAHTAASTTSTLFQTPNSVSIQTENKSSRHHIIPKATTTTTTAVAASVATSAPSRIIHLIATNVNTANSSLTIPPPPPYDTALPLHSIQSQASNNNHSIANQTVNLIRQCYEAGEGMNTTHSSTRHKLLPTITTTIDLDAKQSSNSNEMATADMPARLSTDISEKQRQSMISNGKAISNLIIDCGEPHAATSSSNVDNTCSTGVTDDNMVIDETCSVIHMNDKYIKNETHNTKNSIKRSPMDKLKPGLKVLSDVKLSPNAALNVSTLNTQLNESVNLDHMIVVGTSSSRYAKKLASYQRVRNDEIVEEATDLSSKSGTSYTNNIPSDTTVRSLKITDSFRDRPSTSREKSSMQLPAIIETIDLSIDTKPCSSKATSVIRLASPNKSAQAFEPPVPRPMIKVPFNKLPKKLIVKLKRPFVPVIEEEANLHPPEPSEPLKMLIKQEENNKSSSNTEPRPSFSKKTDGPILECSEDVPFSPLRQSYTPLPPVEEIEFEITELGDEDDMDGEQSNSGDGDNNIQHAGDVYNNVGFVSELVELDGDVPTIIEDESEFDRVAIVNVSSEGVADDPDEDETWENSSAAAGDKMSSDATAYNRTTIKLDKGNVYNASTSTSSEPSSSSQSNFLNSAPNARQDYGLSSFLGYNEQHEGEYFYSGVRLSPIGFANENNPWNQRFSPQYAPFEVDKNSYMDLDMCKNTSSGDRAPSTDSLNIRTDEKMPAKGEISEQESNGDASWNHQIYPTQDNDNLPRYMSSYDTTVARESWSLSNEQNLSHAMENMSTILSKLTSMEQGDQCMDIKPSAESLLLGAKFAKDKLFTKARKYRCPVCSKVFTSLKEKRLHLVTEHDYQEGLHRIKTTSKSLSLKLSKKPIATITSASCSTPTISADMTLFECKKENETAAILANATKPVTSLNSYLLSYNWTTLKAKPGELLEIKNEKIFKIIDSGTNYVCRICEESFASIRAYDLHMFIHPAECYTCGRTFKRWVNFSVHLKRHLNIRDHKCMHCSKKFVLRQNMLEHMRVHSGEAPLKCKICSKRFKRYSNLIQHRNRHHLKVRPKDKDFICSCGEVFHSQAKIAWHRETHDAKPKCCPYCRERFMHKNSLVRHIRLSHTERFHLLKRDSVECPHCNKKYIKSSLKMHMEQHCVKRNQTYECTICNKKLTTKWNLKQHRWIHASRSSKPFKCGLCSKAFIRETEYTSHMNTHKSVKPYTCDHCGCQFARKYNWLRHTREHEQPKKFRCETCGKVFHRAYYLTEHKRTHTGARPYECTICGKQSSTKTNHNKHVKIHHARDPLTAEG